MKDEKRNPLDDLFRKKLNGEQLPPDDKLWGEIEQRIDERKNRRGLLLIFLSLGGILLTSAIIYMLLNNNPVTKNNAKETITENTAATINSTAAHTGTNPISSTEKNNSIDSVQKTTSATIATPSSSAAGSSASPQKTMPSSLTVKGNSTHSRQQVTSNTNSAITPSNSATTPSSNEQAGVSSSGQYNTPMATTFKEDSSSTMRVTGMDTANKVVPGHIYTFAEIQKLPANKNLDNVSLTADSTTKEKEKENVIRKDTVAIPPVAKKSRVTWYVEAGIDFVNNTKYVKANSSADPYYLQKRNAEESAITTFNYIAKLGLQLNHLQLEGGFTIYRVGENVQYTDRAICYNLVSAGYYSGHTYVYKYDTINYHLEKNDSVTRKNGRSVNTYVGIPIQALYNFSIKGVRFQAGVGIATLLPSQWNSWYIDTRATALEDPVKMLNPILFDANVNAGVVIPLTDFLDAIATLEYHRNLNSVFKSAYSVQQGYSGVGTGVSVRYNFGNK